MGPGEVRRLQAALTAGPQELYQVITDPAAEILRAALKNRNLGEEHLLVLLKRRDLPEDLLRAVSQLDVSKKSHPLKLALVRNPQTPASVALSLLPHLYLFELLNLCILPGGTPDQCLAAERQIIQRLPSVEIGNKLTLSRRATPVLLEALMREGESRVVQACLDNPRLRESSILQFLRSGKATGETISMVARHPRWKSRPNIRQAILKNSRTPAVWYTLWLPNLTTGDLKGLLAGRTLTAMQKREVERELRKRGMV